MRHTEKGLTVDFGLEDSTFCLSSRFDFLAVNFAAYCALYRKARPALTLYHELSYECLLRLAGQSNAILPSRLALASSSGAPPNI